MLDNARTNANKTLLPLKKNERWRHVDENYLHEINIVKQKNDDVSVADIIKSRKSKWQHHLFMVFVNGEFQSALSDLNNLPNGLVVSSLQDASHANEIEQLQARANDARDKPFVNEHFNENADALFVYVAKQTKISETLHFLFINSNDQSTAAFSKQLIFLDDHAELSIFSEQVDDHSHYYFLNQLSLVNINPSAIFNYYKIQAATHHARYIAHLFCEQKANSQFNHFAYAKGAGFYRDETIVTLQESGSMYDTTGLYTLAHDKQFMQHYIEVKHMASRTQSEMRYKGILENKSHAVFNGRVYVNKDAQKISALQENHHLLLSPNAEVNTKPELEIYADDVKCKHGATIGQLDEQAIFYMQSRGISFAEAKKILLNGFIEDNLKRIPCADIRAYVESL